MTLERETILAMDITELLDKLKNGELDPLAVLQAYQVRILKIYNFNHFPKPWSSEKEYSASSSRASKDAKDKPYWRF